MQGRHSYLLSKRFAAARKSLRPNRASLMNALRAICVLPSVRGHDDGMADGTASQGCYLSVSKMVRA